MSAGAFLLLLFGLAQLAIAGFLFAACAAGAREDAAARRHSKRLGL